MHATDLAEQPMLVVVGDLSNKTCVLVVVGDWSNKTSGLVVVDDWTNKTVERRSVEKRQSEADRKERSRWLRRGIGRLNLEISERKAPGCCVMCVGRRGAGVGR